MHYSKIIGLEVHVQLLTRTKLFCGCSTQFGKPPNSSTCPVCLGLPGALPVMNKRAFELALRAATALNCEIAYFTKWDRKNYFYPDLPKNFQTSQYDLPFSTNGWLEIRTASGEKRIGIIRVHLEEDAGKMLHDESGAGNRSLVDLNRAGTPLLEIVSQPELTSAADAKTYLEEIRLLMRALEASDCEMQEGSLRCDANVNIQVLSPSSGKYVATPIVEIKNLNSFRAVERAINYEANRQFEEYQRSGIRLDDVPKTTAGWDDVRGVTVIQRRKEEAADYRYFPEPDLVPIVVDDLWKQRVRDGLGELPAALRKRLQVEFELTAYDAGVITSQGPEFARYFEAVAKESGDAKAASNWLTNQVLQTLNETQARTGSRVERGQLADDKVAVTLRVTEFPHAEREDYGHSIADFPISASALAGLIVQLQRTGLNMQRSREVYAHMLKTGASAEQAIGALGFRVVDDEATIRDMVRRAIAANPKAVTDYRAGKTKAADAIKGAVMRETKGLANTERLQRIVNEEMTRIPE